MTKPTLEEARALAADGRFRTLPVSREIFSDFTTPIKALQILKGVSRRCYLLESAEDSRRWGRYTFLGFDPSMGISCTNGNLTIEAGTSPLTFKGDPREAILLSPGPGRPADAGICEEAVQKLSGKIPILGVCLGHQAICEAFGGTVGYAKTLMHGKSSLTKLAPSCPLFQDLPPEIPVARYHSLAAKEPLPPDLEAAAVAEDGEIMALQHKTHPTFGLQFHPESILTPDGETILKNFLTFAQNQKQEGSL